MKSLKLKSCIGENIIYFCAAILVDSELLDSARSFKPVHLGYTTCIFQDTSDSRFCLWAIQKYKDFTDFIKKLCVCDMNFIPPQRLITYKPLVLETICEFHDLVDLKQWEPVTGKEKSKDQASISKAYTVEVDQLVNKALKKFDFKIHRSGNAVVSGGGSSARLNVTCHKCNNKGHIQK